MIKWLMTLLPLAVKRLDLKCACQDAEHDSRHEVGLCLVQFDAQTNGNGNVGEDGKYCEGHCSQELGR